MSVKLSSSSTYPATCVYNSARTSDMFVGLHLFLYAFVDLGNLCVVEMDIGGRTFVAKVEDDRDHRWRLALDI